jgi:hypothetical protein
MVTVKKIDIGSAFRVGALLTGIFSLILFIPFTLCQLSLLPALLSDVNISGRGGGADSAFFSGISGLGAIGGLLCGVVIYTVIGGIFAAAYALVYNLVARQFGGLQVQLDGLEQAMPAPEPLPPSKRKTDFFDANFENG